MREGVPLICPTPQAAGLRRMTTTGKSATRREIPSSDPQWTVLMKIVSRTLNRRIARRPEHESTGNRRIPA
jgi:hypothetical protein